MHECNKNIIDSKQNGVKKQNCVVKMNNCSITGGND